MKIRLAVLAILSKLFLLGVSFPDAVIAQQQPPTPQLISIFPAGGQLGNSVEVKIVEQSELEFADELLFSHEGITCRPKLRGVNRFYPKPVPVRNEFIVNIGKEVPPGIYEVRARCEYGMSNPRRFVVTQNQEILETEPNDRFELANELSANMVANGTFEAGYDFYKVNVKKGQSLVFRCVSEQLDSRGDPVITLFDEKQRTIAKNHDTAGKDALISYQATEDGIVFARVNDLTFVSQGGAGTTSYRLIVTESPWIDFIEPPVIPRGIDASVTVFGRNLGGAPSGKTKNGVELESLEVVVNSKTLSQQTSGMFSDSVLVPSRYSSRRLPFRFANQHGLSNTLFLDLSDQAVVPEDEARSTLTLGSEVLGVFAEAGEMDRYRFKAKKGDKIWIEVVSQRLGISTDPLLVIESIQKDKNGQEVFRTLSTVDDYQPMSSPFRFRLGTEDPGTLFDVPADGDYRITVSDQFNLPANSNGPNYYKLVFRRPEAHVDLVAIAGLERGPNDNNSRPLKIYPCIVRPRGGAEIQVFAYRSPGFDKPIELSVEGLPAGVTCLPTVINGSANHGTLVLQGEENLKSGIARVKVVGTYADGDQKVTLSAANAEITTNSVGNEPSESRLTDEIFVVADSTVQFPGRIKLAKSSFKTARGGVVEAKAKLEKSPGHTGPILQAFLHGFPRTVSKNTNTIQDNGSEVTYRIDFRQGTPAGTYSTFVRGYFESNTKRFEKRFEEVSAEQKRIASVLQKVESEYRKATQERQRLVSQVNSKNQEIARLASPLRSVKTELSAAQKTVDQAKLKFEKLEIEKNQLTAAIKSLEQMSTLEMDDAKKKQMMDELAARKQKNASLEQKLSSTRTTLDAAKASLDSKQKKREMLVVQETALKTELTKLQELQKEVTEKESHLTKERTLGQAVKREVDAELNLARQAAQQRRRRFQVYSEPIRIEVAEYPIDLQIAKKVFVLEQGTSEKVTLNLKRFFEFKGNVTLQLRPGSGASGWSLKGSPRFGGDQEQLEIELVAASTAKVGEFSGQIQATMRNGSTNLNYSIPISVEIQPKKK